MNPLSTPPSVGPRRGRLRRGRHAGVRGVRRARARSCRRLGWHVGGRRRVRAGHVDDASGGARLRRRRARLLAGDGRAAAGTVRRRVGAPGVRRRAGAAVRGSSVRRWLLDVRADLLPRPRGRPARAAPGGAPRRRARAVELAAPRPGAGDGGGVLRARRGDARRAGAPPPLGTVADLHDELEAAGWRDVAVHTHEEAFEAPDAATFWAGLERTLAPLALMRHRMGDGWAPVRDRIGALVCEKLGDGPVVARMPAWVAVGRAT